MSLYLAVTAASEVAVDSTKVTVISEAQLELLRPLIEAIKNFKPYYTHVLDNNAKYQHTANFPRGLDYRVRLGEIPAVKLYKDVVSPEVIELFYTFMPDDMEINHILGVHVFTVTNVEALFELKWGG